MTVGGGGGVRSALLRVLFRGYKVLVSPLLHGMGVSRCIYLPTCSEYAYVAMSRYGVVRGGAMAAARVARCNPLSRGGFDPVP